MLVNRKNNSNSIFSSEVVERLGMSPNGVFQIVGTAPEPQYAWEPEEQRFTDVVSGFGLWVRQDYNQFKQNPILVVIPHMSEKKLKALNLGKMFSLTIWVDITHEKIIYIVGKLAILVKLKQRREAKNNARFTK